MEIVFANKKIKKQCEDFKLAQKNFNKEVAEKLYSTINYINNAVSLLDVKNMPTFHLHALKGDRKGTYSIDLGRRLGYRLIITPLNDEHQEWDTNDEYIIYNSTKIILAMEVSNHYE
ncbi:type II toxin-antitoxin system RelE/ParE family toxin [Velocimicrobium porci]|uniref:Addiction module toxin RelE n=1 Tax=Velocimicrobium porci TaxID=2606634 RepID=A0A6L5Y397_9FIRM|nr:type II toxin-antitoxin system RelE/ParE family toxin [Velocimicrobium porci]MSS64613.1 addiction module toxin RelE [Velocimicrobium porci]